MKYLVDSIKRLDKWLQDHDFKGYDPFEGLNSKLRFLTFEIPLLRQMLIQGVRRVPVNIRPIIGISPQKSSKGMAYIARGDLLLYKLTGEEKYLVRAEKFLDWLEKNHYKGYSGYCWGNHFDYQTRGYFLKKNSPTLVWTSLTGRAFVEAYEITQEKKYRDIVDSACTFILNDFPKFQENGSICISYVTNTLNLIHNANLLGAALLAQGYKLTGKTDYKVTAEKAVKYSVNHQREDGSWFYGEEEKYHWIDNWHTAYNLDSLRIYENCIGDRQIFYHIKKGLQFYLSNFFLSDGTPKYYHNSVFPIDIQCASQSIDTLVFFKEYNLDNLSLAHKIAQWTIDKMQDEDGHFYYWKGRLFLNKIPTLHWGQATMYHALVNLLSNP